MTARDSEESAPSGANMKILKLQERLTALHSESLSSTLASSHSDLIEFSIPALLPTHTQIAFYLELI